MRDRQAEGLPEKMVSAATLEQFVCATGNSVLESEGYLRNLTDRSELREVLRGCHQCPAAICPKLSANTDREQLWAGSVPMDNYRSLQVQ